VAFGSFAALGLHANRDTPRRPLHKGGDIIVYSLSKAFFACLLRIIGNPVVSGRHNIPTAGAFVVVANHASLIDGPLLVSILPRRATFLSAAYLFKRPLVGPFLRAVGAIPVQTDQAGIAGLKSALSVLREGGALVLFPEGGIGHNGGMQPFQLGWAYLAIRAGAPVLPVHIQGTNDVLPVGARIPRLARITVHIAPCWKLPLEQHPSRETLASLNARLAEQLYMMEPPSSSAPPAVV